MEIPISVLKYQFTKNMITLINDSGLPLCVAEDVIKNIYYDVKKMSQNQLKEDIEKIKRSDNKESNRKDMNENDIEQTDLK